MHNDGPSKWTEDGRWLAVGANMALTKAKGQALVEALGREGYDAKAVAEVVRKLQEKSADAVITNYMQYARSMLSDYTHASGAFDKSLRPALPPDDPYYVAWMARRGLGAPEPLTEQITLTEYLRRHPEDRAKIEALGTGALARSSDLNAVLKDDSLLRGEVTQRTVALCPVCKTVANDTSPRCRVCGEPLTAPLTSA